ncbi:MAG: hypothetical protein AAGA58_12475 [Verrucomicrobiota bacterium]
MIQKAFESGNLVRIDRANLEAGSSVGYLVGHSDELVMLQLVDSEIRFNGFQILRVEDITTFECPAPHQDFIENAMNLRKLEKPTAPDLDLTNLGMAFATLKRNAPLVTVYLELDEPDACYIGRVDTVSHDSLTMYYIDPDAYFDDEPTDYRLSQITRIDFGGGYEEALHLVSEARTDKGGNGVLS